MAKTPVGAASAFPPNPALDAAHAAMLRDNQLQFHFSEQPPPQPPPAWLEPVARFFGAIAPLLQYVFWAGVVLIVAVILFAIGNEIARRMPVRAKEVKKAEPAPQPTYKPSVAQARALLEEADRLAAQGRYGEAVRILLHRSIEDLERVFSLAIGPALTSREIAQLRPLSDEGRSVFSGIAAAVEASLFGGQTIEASRYQTCRTAYAAFASHGSRR